MSHASLPEKKLLTVHKLLWSCFLDASCDFWEDWDFRALTHGKVLTEGHLEQTFLKVPETLVQKVLLSFKFLLSQQSPHSLWPWLELFQLVSASYLASSTQKMRNENAAFLMSPLCLTPVLSLSYPVAFQVRNLCHHQYHFISSFIPKPSLIFIFSIFFILPLTIPFSPTSQLPP
jgi:hypothetical protein